MKVFIDTNAVIDFCYRYYPQDIFPAVWDKLQNAIKAKQIAIYLVEHIEKELDNKILAFGYDKNIFDSFIKDFNIIKLDEQDYDDELIIITRELGNNVSYYNKKPKALDKKKEDLSIIATAKKNNGTVLTSEQGFGQDIANINPKYDPKIPDICKYYKIDCGNWRDIYEYIGLKL